MSEKTTPKHFSKKENNEIIDDNVQRIKTVPYWISFGIMMAISIFSFIKILTSTLSYIQGGSADKTVVPMILACFSTGAMFLFTLLLFLKFFKGSQSIIEYSVPLVCLGIATSLGVFFTNFFEKAMIFSHVILILNLILSILILVHTFFIPEFNYYVDGIEESDDEISDYDDEDDLENERIIETEKYKSSKENNEEKPAFKKKTEDKDDEDWL